ncbi:putative TetR family transcriptional regulator [Streptomyces sp. NBRC 110611]|uniref:TetR/AcrR family transcriptional regulator n=1 Tax=Streptomyces sp. NBRC 110611 TaxID=1621259 RepID=UPI000833F081|nr:TetR/AcrR family transcriptional regulator [Streptomyces sp. NBRC 110611]GAU64668.1 putative TetR family transcriptional regulator [Streptomyces sp. NBRC 110611]
MTEKAGKTGKEPGAGKASTLTRQGGIRRTSLLDAAETVLVAKGADASLRAIAAEAGVRVGHLQHYFPTRADLIKAVLERALDRSLERLAETTGLRTGRDEAPGRAAPAGPAADRDADPGEVVADPGEVVAVVLAEQDDPRLVRLYAEVWALAARDDEIAAVVREFYQKYVAHVEAFVRQGRPDWPGDLCRARAETFVALVEGAALLRSGIAGSRSAAMDAQLGLFAVRLLRGEG